MAPNGATHTEKFHPNQKVSHVLGEAVKYFGDRGDLDPSKQYVLVFDKNPLDPSSTLADAGVKAGDTLKVRAQAIPGDG